MRKELYHVAVLFDDEDEGTKVIVGPQILLAKDVKDVRILAGRMISEDYISEMEKVRIVVSPF